MEQDNDWVIDNDFINKKYYYKDNLHLIEDGNQKFMKSIQKAISHSSPPSSVSSTSLNPSTEKSSQYFPVQKSFVKQNHSTCHPSINISLVKSSNIPPYQNISHIYHRPLHSSFIYKSQSPSSSS